MMGCVCHYCHRVIGSCTNTLLIHVLQGEKPHIIQIVLTDSTFPLIRCSPARSWKYPSIQSIKLRELNVVRTSARWAACAPVSSIRTGVPSTAGGPNACLAVPASNARSPSSWLRGRVNNRSNRFTVRSSYFDIICVCLQDFIEMWSFFLFFFKPLFPAQFGNSEVLIRRFYPFTSCD